MAGRNISDLIQKGQDALGIGDNAKAKRLVLQAIAGADIEKESFLTGLDRTLSEQQLADWYGGCSFILNQIGEDLTATRCFYQATVFDSHWNFQSHKDVSDVLWCTLVFLRDVDDLVQDLQKMKTFLTDLDKTAKLAERRKRWHVCVSIDGDINKIYNYLRTVGVMMEEIIAQPGRKTAMWRSARCFLQMGMHRDCGKLCSTILQHVSDYDDSEAFEIWARSLYETDDFDLAYGKNELALKYCHDEDDRHRLKEFRSKIQEKLDMVTTEPLEPDEKWLDGTNVNNSGTSASTSGKKKKKKRHKRPKAKDRTEQNTPSPRAGSVEKDKVSRSPSKSPPKETATVTIKNRTPAPKTITTAIQRLQNEDNSQQRSRHSSTCSTETTATDASFDYTASDSDSDSNDDDDTSARTEDPDAILMTEEDIEAEAMHEKMSFYEQSCRYHLQNEQFEEYPGTSTTEEKLLKSGIQLNMSYLHQFEDTHPDILKRDLFYTEFLTKDQLKEKLLLNPKKYLRCVIQIEGAHEAICIPVDSKNEISLIEISGRSKIGQAFNEDEVVIELLDTKDSKDKWYGKVIGIWNRQRHNGTKHPVFICTLDNMESHLLRPMCKTIPKIHVIDREITKKIQKKNARRYKIEMYDYDERAELLCNPRIVEINPSEQRSYIFLVAFINWGPRHVYPRGAIIKRLSGGNSITTGLTILNLQHEVPTLYKKKTVEQVASILKRTGEEPPDCFLHDRTDLTGLNIFTIDPPASGDLDDALSVERIDGGYKVGVHISDVAMFVPKDSPVDEEAKLRATTFYPGVSRKPRNMLPEPLSSNLCSLLPGKRRLTISIFFYMDEHGRLMQMEGSNYEVLKSVIKSRRQLTYGEAQHMLTAEQSDNDDQLRKDIRCLFKLAKAMRMKRLGNAMFAIDVDWEESHSAEAESETVEAHYLVEEFMVLANHKMADKLRRSYRHCVPFRCQPPPSQEKLEEFVKKNDKNVDILLRLQDKQIGSTKTSFSNCLDEGSSKSVMLSKPVWERIKASPKSASRYILKDDLHPLQIIAYQSWLSIQERAGYRCSGSLTGEKDGKHYSLDMYPYTHFTSPIRRYIDLIVHRLVHAAVFQKARSPYEKEEIDTICLHINSVTRRAKEYENGCRSLQQAIDFKASPKMINCFVDEVSDRGLTFCSPFLKHVSKSNKELPFNHLDMGFKPEVFDDKRKVTARWRKRLYDFKKTNCPPNIGTELKLNSNKGIIFLHLHDWASMLKYTIEGHDAELARAIRTAKPIPKSEGLDDVSTECSDPLKIQPNTKFSMTFSRGQQVRVQMSAAPYRGIIAPKPMLYNMTNNVRFCLQHTDDPVLFLYHYVTQTTIDQYKNVKKYLERWIPIILMESATGIVRSEESCCINNVQIKFGGDRKGKFALGLGECEVRNIELSGTESDDDDEDNSSDGGVCSYDWLCLKTTLPNPKTSQTTAQDIPYVASNWVGHADVTKVKKNKDAHPSGKITVSFSLHERAPEFPSNFRQSSTDTRFSVEILRKSEVDRRTERFIKTLPSVPDTLAVQIALNKQIPGLDKSHMHNASLIERDLYYEASSDDPLRKALPCNNKKQQEAINKALQSRFSLIQGPPGTGKTYTGIKLIYLFSKINNIQYKEGKRKQQVLFCGPSNKSVDLVAHWMLNRMGKFCPKFVRVYGRSIEALDFPIPGRTFLSKRSTRNQKMAVTLRSVALHYIIREKGKKNADEIRELDKLFKDNDYVPMAEKARRYVHIIREASIEEIRKHDVILCTTAVGSNPKVLEATSVQQVIVDEAGMCPEPQCLVPIIATKAEQVVLIGDHKQLRPIIMCKEAALLGLETSLFERYAESELSQNVQFTMLDKQYRMNPEICKFPSNQFYDGQLKTKKGSWDYNKLSIWPRDFKGEYPFIFIHIEGEEKMLTVSTEDGNEQSKSNSAEIDAVVNVYSYLTRQNEEVQILSQYNAQCAEIKRKLVADGYIDENVSTVVSSQGGEWDYVIFSTVRSLPEYKIEQSPTLGWCKHNLGSITDRNQVNVAITRARKGLIIIGNKNLLACDFVWKKLIRHYEQRGCIKMPDEFPPKYTKSRRQIMIDQKDETYRRYGDSIYTKGEGTSYGWDFAEECEGGGARSRKRAPRYECK